MAKKKEVVKEKNEVSVEDAAKEVVTQEEVSAVTETKVEEVKTEKVEEFEIKAGEVINANDSVQTCSNDKVVVALNYPQNVQFVVRPGTSYEHTVEFFGNAHHLVGKEMGVLPIGAFGLTPNVDKDDWEWIKQNYRDMGLIRNGLLFAASSNTVRDEARERKELRNGFEPVAK